MECLKEDIPQRYHKYIPSGYSGGNSRFASNRSTISTINLPNPQNNTLRGNSFHSEQQLDFSSGAAGPPSYRSRSNIQVILKEAHSSLKFEYVLFKDLI